MSSLQSRSNKLDEAIKRVSRQPRFNQNVLWCPGLDPEMRGRAASIITALPNMYHQVLEGGKGGLGDFFPTVTLYILAHGHSSMPLFTTKAGTWTANQLVDLLVRDGLSHEQRDIELLVCHAGESVNTREGAAKLMNIRDQALKAKDQGKLSKFEEFKKKFAKLESQKQPAAFFETDPEKLLLPLAAQFSQALKNSGFTHFRITSYKCPVAQYNPDAHIYLNLTPKGGAWGVSADEQPQYRVVWH